MKKIKKYRLIDLFCGCGGLTKGFWDTGRFEIVLANDNDSSAIKSYQLNFDPQGKHADCRDIIDLVEQNPQLIPPADIVIGGPPCQGFSLLNKNRIGDKRRELWQYYIEVVRLSNASLVVMENVPQLMDSPEFISIVTALKELGFNNIMGHILNAANHGVPEIRKRTILIASKDNVVALPLPSHLAKEKITEIKNFSGQSPACWLTVRDAIGDLPIPEGVEIRDEKAPLNLHFGRTPSSISLERYKVIPPGGNRFDLLKNRPDITPQCWIKKKQGGTDLFGRLWWDKPSVTIRTEFFKPEKGRYLHPEQHRPITHREAARIQSFPDDFMFFGSKTSIAKQIGNAVPIKLAAAIARRAVDILDGNISSADRDNVLSVYKSWLGEKIKVNEYGSQTSK